MKKIRRPIMRRTLYHPTGLGREPFIFNYYLEGGETALPFPDCVEKKWGDACKKEEN